MALVIGGCTIAELKNRMTANEARSWKRFLRITGPVGYERHDWNFALLRKMILDVNTTNNFREDAKNFLLTFILPGKEKSVREIVENGKNELIAVIGKFKVR